MSKRAGPATPALHAPVDKILPTTLQTLARGHADEMVIQTAVLNRSNELIKAV